MSKLISLRPEAPEDDPFVFDLYETTRDYEMKLIPWPGEQKKAFLREQCRLQLIHFRQHYRDADFQIVLLDCQPIGRFYVHRGVTEIRVIDISLLPEHRRKGLGTQLIQDLQSEANKTTQSITLHVERNNPARRMYERLGFRAAEENGIYVFMQWTPSAALCGSAAP